MTIIVNNPAASSSGTPPGAVYMYWDGSAWQVKAPDGSAVSTSGTTTSGLQEAINYAQTNGYNLIVRGPTVTSAASEPALIDCTGAVTIGPNTYTRYDIAAIIRFSSFTGNSFIIDTLDNCEVNISGQILRSGGSSGDAAVLIFPQHAEPLNSGKVFQSSRINIKGVTLFGTTSISACVAVAWTTNFSIVNNRNIHLGTLDAAGKADNCIQVTMPTTGTGSSFNDNGITWDLLTGYKINAVLDGTATKPADIAFGPNYWAGSIECNQSGASNHFQSYASFDTIFISSMDIDTGTVTNGFTFNSGANKNFFFCPEIVATTNNLSDSGTDNYGFYCPSSGTPVFYMPGTTTNDSAPAGHIGEVLTSQTTNGTSTVTITNASPGVVSWTAHGLNIGSAVSFTTTGALPTGLSVGTNYYVSSQGFGVNSFSVSTSVANALAGTSVNTSSAGSGTHTANSFVIMTTDTAVDITGVSLTPGQWMVYTSVEYHPDTTTTQTYKNMAPSTSSGAYSFSQRAAQIAYNNIAIVFDTVLTGTPIIVRLNSTTTYFLEAQAGFGTSFMHAYGTITAVRMR